MQVYFKMFKSQTKSWETLFSEAAEYASSLSPNELINISHSCDQMVATVTVWFWGKAN